MTTFSSILIILISLIYIKDRMIFFDCTGSFLSLMSSLDFYKKKTVKSVNLTAQPLKWGWYASSQNKIKISFNIF